MTDKEIIARQAAEANEVKQYFFNEAQHSIRANHPSPVEEHNMIVHLIKMRAIS